MNDFITIFISAIYLFFMLFKLLKEEDFIRKNGRCIYSGYTEFKINNKIKIESTKQPTTYVLYITRINDINDSIKISTTFNTYHSSEINDSIFFKEDIYCLNKTLKRYLTFGYLGINNEKYNHNNITKCTPLNSLSLESFDKEYFMNNKKYILDKCRKSDKKERFKLFIISITFITFLLLLSI